MANNRFRSRLDALFADVEHLAADPDGMTPQVRHELESLRARLAELEAEMHAHEDCPPQAADPAPMPVSAAPVLNEEPSPLPDKQEGGFRLNAPILYEKEEVGFVYTENRVVPVTEALTELPAQEPGVTAPLVASGQPIGKVQVAPPAERTLSPEETALLNAVAQQASVQIQNLRLLEATERARAEAEAATRRFMHESWDSFMDGIHQSERVGYAYDQNAVTPFLESPHNEGYQEDVQVMDEQVGTVFLKPDPSRPLTEDDKEMVASIARQVAQQVENIRLLADASRARAEAEEATRRLSRESWQAYTAQHDASDLGFVYNANQVLPLNAAPLPQKVTFSQPLTVRGETIGQLAVADMKNLSPEAADLATAIAERVSVHLETLRLAEEIQKRASELETVAKVSTTASTVLNPDELLQSVVDLTKERFGLYHAHVYLANETWDTLLLSTGAGEVGRTMVEEQHAIPMDAERSVVAHSARERKAIIVNDVRAEVDYMPNPLLPDTRSEMAVPMIVGDKVIGVFDVQSEKANHFTDEEANIFTTLTSQVAVALQNARLYEEQSATVSQLRELDRLKSSFLANMSHELRTPLNSILGFADVMLEGLDGPLTDNMDNDLRLIQKNGQHLLHLINDVLDMAKIESGRMNLHPEKFRLNDLLEDVCSLTSSLASERNNALFIEPGSDMAVELNADHTRIRQVMLNLVNNAIKFTDHGKISICAERKDELVYITVKDTGLGIPPDKLEDIFMEFTQVDTSTTRKVGGTGLGLPISRRLIEMHGGRLWAESSGVSGEGSVFFVELPLEARLTEPVEKVQK